MGSLIFDQTSPGGAVVADSRFLQHLPEAFQAVLEPDLETVLFARGEIIMQAGEEMTFVYFPTDCLISLVVMLNNGDTIEASTVGTNGFVGLSALLGLNQAETTAMVQVAGEARRMKTDAFRNHLSNAQFHELLAQFASFTLSSVAQSIACIAFHPAQERLARWLLQVRDGIGRDDFVLTQQFLAVMLGVHRPTVTIASQVLSAAGLVEYRRGSIRIIDAEALTRASCECYRLFSYRQPATIG